MRNPMLICKSAWGKRSTSHPNNVGDVEATPPHNGTLPDVEEGMECPRRGLTLNAAYGDFADASLEDLVYGYVPVCGELDIGLREQA